MTIKFLKWTDRKDYFKKLIDITSEPYPALTNKEVLQEVNRLLKNSWLSRRVEANLIELKHTMNQEKVYLPYKYKQIKTQLQ